VSAAELELVISVFLASAVEAVEALTIVIAVGQTRSWTSALAGVAGASVALAAAIALLGTALATLPLDPLHLVIGALLLALGSRWLGKAILRAAGLKAPHDEHAIFERERVAARSRARAGEPLDSYTFWVSFHGVVLEGLEVALIVITLGAHQHRLALATVAAAAAVAVVVAAGLAVRGPLERVPENTMKFAVGVMLCSFGIFWAGEGLGISWPGGDAALPAIVLAVLGGSLLAVLTLRRGGTAGARRQPPP
jgi:uncharacterized membrane protein